MRGRVNGATVCGGGYGAGRRVENEREGGFVPISGRRTMATSKMGLGGGHFRLKTATDGVRGPIFVRKWTRGGVEERPTTILAAN